MQAAGNIDTYLAKQVGALNTTLRGKYSIVNDTIVKNISSIVTALSRPDQILASTMNTMIGSRLNDTARNYSIAMKLNSTLKPENTFYTSTMQSKMLSTASNYTSVAGSLSDKYSASFQKGSENVTATFQNYMNRIAQFTNKTNSTNGILSGRLDYLNSLVGGVGKSISSNATNVQNRLQAIAANVTKAMKATETANRANAIALQKASEQATAEADAAVVAGQEGINKLEDVLKESMNSRRMSADTVTNNIESSTAKISNLLSKAFTSGVDGGKDFASMDAMNQFQRSFFLANMTYSTAPMDSFMAAYNQSLQRLIGDDESGIADARMNMQNKLSGFSQIITNGNREINGDIGVMTQLQNEASDELHQIDLTVGDMGLIVTDPVFKQGVDINPIKNQTQTPTNFTAVKTAQSTEFANLLARVDGLIQQARR